MGPRVFDIASDQIRSLRSRMFVNALTSKKAAGALVRMGNSVRDVDISVGRQRPPADYGLFQADREASLALKHPTNLCSFSADTFQRVVRHGYEVADATLTACCPALAPAPISWSCWKEFA